MLLLEHLSLGLRCILLLANLNFYDSKSCDLLTHHQVALHLSILLVLRATLPSCLVVVVLWWELLKVALTDNYKLISSGYKCSRNKG